MAAALAEALPAGWAPGSLEVAAEPGGAPYARLAPEADPVGGLLPGQRLPVAVSISHAEGHALCAATGTGTGAPRTLGIDLGLVEPRSPALLETFFTAEERSFVDAAPAAGHDLRANLVWCAKEAVLKVLGLGLTVDTLGLTCLPEDGAADPAEWPLCPAGGAWRRFQARCAPALLPGGGVISGIWQIFNGFVGALAAGAREFSPPVPRARR